MLCAGRHIFGMATGHYQNILTLTRHSLLEVVLVINSYVQVRNLTALCSQVQASLYKG